MTNVLTTVELIHLISEGLTNDVEAQRVSNLARWARVTRLISEVALSVLWRSVPLEALSHLFSKDVVVTVEGKGKVRM